eukprot:3721631-Alexandrium_andersonii.AAC.1
MICRSDFDCTAAPPLLRTEWPDPPAASFPREKMERPSGLRRVFEGFKMLKPSKTRHNPDGRDAIRDPLFAAATQSNRSPLYHLRFPCASPL